MKKENFLYLEVHPEIFVTLASSNFRTKIEHSIHEYYENAEIKAAIEEEHRFYRPFQAPAYSKVKVEIEHFRSALEGCRSYIDSSLMFRLRMVY